MEVENEKLGLEEIGRKLIGGGEKRGRDRSSTSLEFGLIALHRIPLDLLKWWLVDTSHLSALKLMPALSDTLSYRWTVSLLFLIMYLSSWGRIVSAFVGHINCTICSI